MRIHNPCKKTGRGGGGNDRKGVVKKQARGHKKIGKREQKRHTTGRKKKGKGVEKTYI
jgi:hypothetical protein